MWEVQIGAMVDFPCGSNIKFPTFPPSNIQDDNPSTNSRLKRKKIHIRIGVFPQNSKIHIFLPFPDEIATTSSPPLPPTFTFVFNCFQNSHHPSQPIKPSSVSNFACSFLIWSALVNNRWVCAEANEKPRKISYFFGSLDSYTTSHTAIKAIGGLNLPGGGDSPLWKKKQMHIKRG